MQLLILPSQIVKYHMHQYVVYWTCLIKLKILGQVTVDVIFEN